MTAYAMAQLRRVDQNEEIADYLRRIDDSLAPYGGQFLVHGSSRRSSTATFPASS